MVTSGVTSTKHCGLLAPLLTAKGGRSGIDLVGAKSAFIAELPRAKRAQQSTMAKKMK